MRLRPKTVRRLALLAIVVAIFAGLGAAALIARDWRRQQSIDALRAEGLKLHERARHRDALPLLARYARHRDGDARALLALARTRMSVESGDGSHLVQAASVFRQYRLLEPDNLEPARELLELYRRLGMNREAASLAGELLANTALAGTERTEVLLTRALALRSIDPTDPEAAALIREAAELTPGSFAAQRHRLSLLAEQSPTRACETATALATQHPRPEFQVLRLLACDPGDAGQSAPSPETMREIFAVVERAEQDAFRQEPFLRALLSEAAKAGDRQLTLLTLRRATAAAADHGDWPITYVRTLFQFERFTLAREEADRLLDVRGPQADLIAYRAMAARAAEANPDTEGAIDALDDLPDDFRTRAWADALKGIAALDRGQAADAEALLGTANSAYPGEPALRLLHGDALARLQRTDQAREAWTRADRLSTQPWMTARLRVIRSLLDEGRAISALAAAEEAVRESPRQVDAYLMWLAAFQARFQRGLVTPDHRQTAESVVATLEAAFEAEAPQRRADLERRLLPTRLLLALTDSPPQPLEHILSSPPARLALQNPETATDIAALLISAGIDPPPDLETHLASHETTDPGLPLARAIRLAEQGAADQARAMLQTPEGGDERTWALARARLADRTAGTERAARQAAAQWRALLEAHPRNLELVNELLRSRTAPHDSQLIEAAAHRFAALTGDASQTTPRHILLARARAIQIGEPEKERLDNTIGTLEELVARTPTYLDARVILAGLYLKQDSDAGITPDPDRAAEHLLAASEMIGGSASDAYRLQSASLYQLTRDFDRARDALFRILDAKQNAEPELLHNAARLLLAQGEPDLALTLLEEARDRIPDARRAALLIDLARAHEGRAEDDRAATAYRQALEAGLTEPGHVVAAATFFARTGNQPARQRALAALDEMQPAPGVAALAQARHAEMIGDLNKADEWYARATAGNPARNDAWLSRGRVRAHMGDLEGARRIIREGLARHPGDAQLRILKHQIELALNPDGASIDPDGLAPVIEQGDPGQRRAAQAAAAIATLKREHRLADRDALLKLASRFDDVLAVQTLVGRRLLSAEVADLESSARILSRAADAFPTDAETPRLATLAYARIGDFQQMQSAALRWRSRNPAAAPLADLAIARSALELGQLTRCQEIVDRYLPEALRNPGAARSIRMLQLWVRLAARTGRLDPAFEQIRPLLAQAPEVMTDVWLQAVAESIPSWDRAARWLDAAEQHADSPDALAALIESCRRRADRGLPERAAALSRAADYATRLASDAPTPRLLFAHARVERDLAELAGQSGDEHQQRRRLSQALTLFLRSAEGTDTTTRATRLLAAAATAESLDDPRHATRLYNQVLALEPLPDRVRAAAHNNLAYLILRRGNADDRARALEHVNTALTLSNEPAFLHTRGEILARADRLDDAIESFRLAVRFDADHLPSLAALCHALARTGDELRRQEARGILQRLDETTPDQPDDADALDHIAAARRLLAR